MRWPCLLVMLLFVLPEPAFAQARFPYTAQTVSDRVNVRAGQNNNFESLAILPKGVLLTVLDKKFKWCKVSLPAGAKAFVKSAYIRFLTPDLGEVTVDRLNVRSAPNTDATTVGQLKQGQKVLVQKNAGEWVWIKPAEGVYGWVNESLLVFRSDGAQPRLDPVPNVVPSVKVSQASAARMALLKKNADGSVECAGRLVGAENAPAAYKIINGDVTVCYADGVKSVLDGFIGSEVRLQGTMKVLPSETDAAVILLSKISLAL